MAPLLIRGAFLMRDGSGAFAPDPADLLIEGERIAAIESASTIDGADSIFDAHGLVAAPG